MSLEIGRDVLNQEAAAIQRCAQDLNENFQTAVQWLIEIQGRVITCGLGKSGHIARKAAGTLSSTGTPSMFLHAAEAMHGDLGMVTPQDVVILYSQSGETDEIIRLIPSLRISGAKTVLVTGRLDSTAARMCDLALDTSVSDEACSLNLAPTTSTTVMLALSDALAIAVMTEKGFGRDDFARFHPSGTLGRRLLLKVSDVMRPIGEIALLEPSASVLEVMQAMTSHGVGAACIVSTGRLTGIISESDLRRHLAVDRNVLDNPAQSVLNPEPATIEPYLLAIDAFEIFQNFPAKIGELPVVENNRLLGLLVLKDLLRSGIM